MTYTLDQIKPDDWIVYATGNCGVGFMGYDTDDRKGIYPRPRQVKTVGKKVLSLVTPYHGRDLVAPEQVLAVFPSYERALEWHTRAKADWDARTIEIKELEAQLVQMRTTRFCTFCSIVKSGTNQ